MPTHPHASYLKEYQIAIDHLVPAVPAHIKEEAQALHDALLANEKATEKDIQEAVIKIGLVEYPYRHAWEEMVAPIRDEKTRDIVFEHIEPSVRKKIEPCLVSGVSLEQFVRSPLFEELLTPEERYQVEDAMLDAPHHIDEMLSGLITIDNPQYKKAYDAWTKTEEKILKAIEKLDQLKDKDPKWKDEIVDKVARFKEGFSVTEPDPSLEEVEKEIEYWEGVLATE